MNEYKIEEFEKDLILLKKILKALEGKVSFNHNLTYKEMALDCFKQFLDRICSYGSLTRKDKQNERIQNH